MKKMMILFIAFMLVFFSYDGIFAQQQIQITKDKALQYAKPKKPVKIKLHRDKKGEYTWDITGENVDDIIKADKRLRQFLERQQ